MAVVSFKRPSATVLRGLAVLLLCACVGLVALRPSKADTPLITSEAELGDLSGNLGIVDDAATPNTRAVQFGGNTAGSTKPAVPAHVQAIGGGDSVAITWYPVALGNQTYISSYNVFRDGVKIATTAPNDQTEGTVSGSQYIDKTAIKGRAYNYQVQSVATTGLVSDLSPITSGSLPQTTTPVPTVTVDSSFTANASASERTWMQNYGIALIQTWYPKLADRFIGGSYAPQSSVVIKSASPSDYAASYANSAAVTVGNTIIVQPTLIDKYTRYASQTLVHESVHILQYYDNGNFSGSTPRWFIEGMAELGTMDIYNGDFSGDGLANHTGSDDYYTDGYDPAGNFLRYANQHYAANYVHDFNLASHNGNYNAAILHFSDGRNTDEAWGQFRGTPTRTGTVKNNSTNSCAAVQNGSADFGTPFVLAPCNNDYPQRLTYRSLQGNQYGMLVVLGNCLSTPASNVQDGDQVSLLSCNKTNSNQLWLKQSDGSLVNPASNLCLEPRNGNAASGTMLAVATCSGVAWQKWTSP